MGWRGPGKSVEVHGGLDRYREYGKGQRGFERTRKGWKGLGRGLRGPWKGGEGQGRVMSFMEEWGGPCRRLVRSRKGGERLKGMDMVREG